jgi:hypothetical protein
MATTGVWGNHQWKSTNGVADEIAKPFTEQQFMAVGLRMANYTMWEKCKEATNVGNFRPIPLTCFQTWESLRVSTDITLRLPKNADPLHLFLALCFLQKYHSEKDIGTSFHVQSETTVRKCIVQCMPRLWLMMKQ